MPTVGAMFRGSFSFRKVWAETAAHRINIMSAPKSALLASLIAFLLRNEYKKFAECAACRTRPPFRLGGCLFASDCSSQTSRATRRSLAGRGRSNYKRAMIKLIQSTAPALRPTNRLLMERSSERRRAISKGALSRALHTSRASRLPTVLLFLLRSLGHLFICK